MDPATVFLLYVVGTLSLWLVGASVRPAIAAMSRVGILVPGGRQLTVLLITMVLMFGVARATAASGNVGPASHRLEQMVDVTGPEQRERVDAPSRFGVMSTTSTRTVVKGDSLWRIARESLSANGSSPSGSEISNLWHSIYEMNLALIGKDPNLIHPGQVLKLPGR